MASTTRKEIAVKLWECTYTLTGKHVAENWVDYWSSTTEIHKSTIERFWHRINTDYVITGYACREIQSEPGKVYHSTIVQ